MCIAIECSYKLDQKNKFKFLCELCTFLQIRSHILPSAEGNMGYGMYCPLRGAMSDIAWEGGFQRSFEPLFDTELSF